MSGAATNFHFSDNYLKMVEFVRGRKENTLTKELPMLNSLFSNFDVRNIVYLRESHECKVMRRNKKKSDFINFIDFLKANIERIRKMIPDSNAMKLIDFHNNRIILLYQAALKFLNDDLSLWIKYIKFLIKTNHPKLLQKVINHALSLHGHNSDSLYVFAVGIEIGFLKNIQKAREIYTSGLQAHKNSSNLYFEAFKCELTYSKILIQEILKSGNGSYIDPNFNASVTKVVFESAVQNVKEDIDLFFQMHRAATQYHFSLDLSKEIKKFMSTTFNMDPNYWDTLATNELLNTSNIDKNFNIIKCLHRYKAALLLVDTDEMWDKYLTAMIKIISDAEIIEIYKINLIKESIHGAHKKNKLKLNHYIQLINNSKGSVTLEFLDWAIEAYPNDTSISEMNIKFKLTDKDELIAYELFKENAYQVSPSIWLKIVEHFSNKPQISHIFNMAFGDTSVCSNKVKIKLANEYLLWLGINKSLNDARNAYLLLNTNNSCDASLCKTLVTLEIGQQIIDVSKIRQHFTLACMQFGKTDIDLWMERIYFELKYGSPKLVSATYHQALETLNNEESDKFAEQYKLKASTFNIICYSS